MPDEPNNLPPRSFFGGESDPEGRDNAGFSITSSASGYGLKSIYTRWYVQNHLQLLTDEEKTKFLSNDFIQKFLEANPATTQADDEDTPQTLSRATFAQISAFKEKLANSEKLRNDYLSLCKTAELGGDIPYNEGLIGKFSDFMGLKDLVASRKLAGTETPVVIDDKLVQEILDGNVKMGLQLRRYIGIKLMQNFTYGTGEVRPIVVSKNNHDHIIDIGKHSLPSLGPVADNLWQARIDKDLSQAEAGMLAGAGTTNISRYENGHDARPTAPLLHKLLTLYKRTDLYDDPAFAGALLKPGPKLNPLGYQLELSRYKLGLSREDFEKKIGITDSSKYVSGTGLPPPDIFKRICDTLGPKDFLENPAVMQQIVAIDKGKQPFAHALRLARYKKGLSRQGVQDAIGVSTTATGSYEEGTATPDAATFKRLSDFLGAESFMGNAAVLEEVVGIDKEKNPFGHQLRLTRYKKGLSQQEVGDAAGATGATIGHYEENITGPDAKGFKKLSDSLGPQDFMGNEAALQQVVGIDKEKNPFGHQLRTSRYKKGLHAQELSEALELSLSPIHQYEDGTKLPAHATFKKICDFLGPADFLENERVMQQMVGIDRDDLPFSYELRARLYKNGMTPTALGQAIGKSVSSIVNYEHAHTCPAPETLKDICRELKWDESDALAQQALQEMRRPGWKKKMTQQIRKNPPSLGA